MESNVEFRLLGPLEVWVDGAVLPLGAPKQQVVLARLAVSAGRVVSLDELIDEVWPARPPVSAVENARAYAASLRRLFDRTRIGRGRIARRGSGYQLQAEVGEVDLLAFEADLRRARDARAQGQLAEAVEAFTDARVRWRGPMVAGLPCGPALIMCSRAVDEERLLLTEDLAEVLLATGQNSDALRLLQKHTSAHPLREHGQALLMVASYRTGDVAGALATYTAVRDLLVEELGLEPGDELQRLHRAVLSRDPLLQPDRGIIVAQSPDPSPARAHELPAEVGDFVGREREAAALREALMSDLVRRRPAVVALYGQGGVGKSALAVRIAHEAASGYPDGQLYVDLLGSTPGLRPLTPVDVLRRFLRSLGVPQDEIPSEEPDATAKFRTISAGRRLLLVLDNADGVAQVVPVIPASPSCGVIITSRRPLTRLDANRHLRIDALPAADGVELLRRLAGESTVGVRIAAEIVELCDHLPLAVRVVAGRLIARSDLSSSDLARRLHDRRRRLDELEIDGMAVRACIRLSYEGLVANRASGSQLAARAFRAIGLLNIPDFPSAAIAAMLNETEVEAALDHLVNVQLIEPMGTERYRVHDLVRLVANEVDEPDAETMLISGMSYYVEGVGRAEHLLRPGRVPTVGPLRHNPLGPEFASLDEARTWLEAEFFNMLAIVEQAGDFAEARWVPTRIGVALSSFLWQRSDWQAQSKIAQISFATALRSGDREMAGWAHWLMGRAHFDLGDEVKAIEHLEEARRALSDAQHHQGVMLVVNGLGKIAGDLGRHAVALAHFRECVALARQYQSPAREAMALHNQASSEIASQRWSDAASQLEMCLAIAETLNDRSRFAASMGMLAVVLCHRNEFDAAIDSAEQSRSYARETGDPLRECESLLVTSEIQLRRGRMDESTVAADIAVGLAVECRNFYLEAAGIRQLAKTVAVRSHHEQAADLLHRAECAFSRPRTRRDLVLEALLTESGPWLPDDFYR